MPAFDYAAYDGLGKLQRGVISADSERHARRLLKEQHLLASSVKEIEVFQQKESFWFLRALSFSKNSNGELSPHAVSELHLRISSDNGPKTTNE